MPPPPSRPPRGRGEGRPLFPSGRARSNDNNGYSNKRARLFAWVVAATVALRALSGPPPAPSRAAAGRGRAAPGGHSLRRAPAPALSQARGERSSGPAPGRGKPGDGGGGGGGAASEERSPATDKGAPAGAAPAQEQEAGNAAPGDVGAVADTAESPPLAEEERAETSPAAAPAQEEGDGKDAASADAVQIDGSGGEGAPWDETRGRARTVGVAVTLTDCGGFPPDGAAVVQYSAMKHQELKSKQGSPSRSRYRYHFYAIYHPSARECALLLADLNFTLLERESPVLPEDIREGSDLKNDIAGSGCCGEKELIKFEVLNLVQHDAVVLLDMDTLVLQSLDSALDLLLDGTVPADPASHIAFHPERPIPDDVWLLYTGDYEIVRPEVFPKPAQGGFTIFKPNRTIYEEIVNIVREGQWSYKFGWGTKEAHTTNHWGSQTFQGLVPYYFFLLNPGHSIELNGCQYNNMNTRPIWPDQDPGTTNVTSGRCLNDRDECEDCRDRTFDRLSSFHFTVCKKPWRCSDPLVPSPGQDYKQRLCREATQAWFDYRSEMEASWGRTGLGSHGTGGNGNEALPVQFWGYCSRFGEPEQRAEAAPEYDPIRLPYGRAAIDAAADESR